MKNKANSDLAGILKGMKDTIYYLPNPGNAGDSLIASATFLFFKRYDIPFIIVSDLNFDVTGKVVAYAGGGNFGGATSRAARFVAKYSKKAKTFILLPHSIFGAEDLLSTLGYNCHIFCRELISYEHVKRYAVNAHVYHHHDIAFTCDPSLIMQSSHDPKILRALASELLRRIKGGADYDLGISLIGLYEYLLFKIKIYSGMKKNQEHILHAFRTDVEKTDFFIPDDNQDLSAIFALSSCTLALSFFCASSFLREINRYKVIYTNRLHLAIGGILLGKEVHIYRNNYYKLKAIYDYSIDGNFSNVFWEK